MCPTNLNKEVTVKIEYTGFRKDTGFWSKASVGKSICLLYYLSKCNSFRHIFLTLEHHDLWVITVSINKTCNAKVCEYTAFK